MNKRKSLATILVRFDDEGNVWVGESCLRPAFLAALLDFLQEAGLILKLRRAGPSRPVALSGRTREVVITVGRGRCAI